ncbi:hypothetical protein VTG60DRAFT_2632 [Thermothelomyces hinnuleus]
MAICVLVTGGCSEIATWRRAARFVGGRCCVDRKEHRCRRSHGVLGVCNSNIVSLEALLSRVVAVMARGPVVDGDFVFGGGGGGGGGGCHGRDQERHKVGMVGCKSRRGSGIRRCGLNFSRVKDRLHGAYRRTFKSPFLCFACSADGGFRGLVGMQRQEKLLSRC